MRISDWSSDVCSSDLADHGEGVVAAEIASPLARSDGLLAGVDQVGVELVLGRVRADPEQAVFRLQPDIHAVGDVVGHQGRPDAAEVDVHADGALTGGSRRHYIAVTGHNSAHAHPSSE